MNVRALAGTLLIAAACAAAAPAPASAFNPLDAACKVAGFVSGAAGKACSVVQKGAKAGKQLLGGHVGSAVKTFLGSGGGGASTATTALGLAAIGVWVLGGAKRVLHETWKVLSETTAPQLRSSWFSGTYWRIAGIALVLTLPFLFAAAIQALVRSDLALLARSTLGYLPLAMLAVSIAAPVTMLLLAASDQLSRVVASAAGGASARFLGQASAVVGAFTGISGSPFLAFVVGIFTVAGTLALWVELVVREAAVYVIVLMLPLAFAALVWPARRVWAVRAVELLVALILSKFAIVAVLSLGGAALGHSTLHSFAGAIAGLALIVMSAFAPWGLLRLLPLSELASSAAGSLRGEARGAPAALERATGYGLAAHDWAASTTAGMRSDADAVASNGHDQQAAADVAARLSVAHRNGAGDEGIAAAAGPDAAETGAAEAEAPDGLHAPAAVPADDKRERLPGMPAMWQAEDRTWRPLTLGLEDGWPPRVWPADEDHGAPAAADRPESPAPADPRPESPAPADPRRESPAPPQEPEDGRL